jgi:large subunit ribosomal protein L30
MTEETKAKKAPAKKAAAKPAAKPVAKKATKSVAKTGKRLRIKQVRSVAGRFAYQKATLIGLGLNKINRVSEIEDTPSTRGMVRAVAHLVEVEEIAA